jgi:hypothetical protein
MNDVSKKKILINLPESYQYHWEVWDKGREIKIWNYCNRVSGVRAVWKNRGKGDKPMYIEVRGGKRVNFGLRFISSIDLNFIWKKFGGVKSIYSTQIDFKPRYKVDKC